jgi:hypothetical protein
MTEYQTPVPKGKTNTLAIISLVASILGVLLMFLGLCIPCTSLISLMFGVAGTIMGFIAKKKIDESMGVEGGRGLAMGGLITGIVVVVISVIIFIIGLVLVGALFSTPAFMDSWY